MPNDIRCRLGAFCPPRSQWTPADEALYEIDDIYRVDSNKAEKLRWKALKFSFEHHYENNNFYRRYCRDNGVTPSEIKEPSDLSRIPLIPDTFFKDYPAGADFLKWLQKITTGPLPTIALKENRPSFEDIIEALQEENFTVTFTSGSSGRFSFFLRDEPTWMRQQYCFAACVADALRSEYDEGDPEMVCLSAFANPAKTHMFTGRVSSALYGTLFDWKNVVMLMDRKITTDSMRIATGRARGIKEKIVARLMKLGRKKMTSTLIQKLEEYENDERKVLIGAPPFVVDALLCRLEEQSKKFDLGNNVWVITGGGWKLSGGKAVNMKEWKERIESNLGVPGENCRDLLGMSECSAFFPGCEGDYKHVPHSIVYPLVLDDNLKPLGYGKYGRFALLDPLTTSYPGFIITGDRVKMLEKCPVCDRLGPVIEPDISRIEGVEARGCAYIARELMTDELAKMTKTR